MIMKLAAFFILIACFTARAHTYAQNVTLNQKNASLQTVFLEIKKQTGCNFLYTDQVLALSKKVTIDVRNVPLEAALNICFKDQPLVYEIDQKTVIVKPRIEPLPIIQEPEEILDFEISGTVVNDQNEPLAGATIRLQKSLRSTQTNDNGKFSFRIEDKNDVLIISYTGMTTVEIPIGNKTVFDVRLQPADNELSDMVVVAYGKQKKATVTGAIVSIQSKEIKQSPAANLAVSLAGRLPGLTAIQRSGEPGRDLTLMFIRGQGTINVQAPIILVDGVERDLTYIDPNEVESVSILKDASSTAIFGVRGANGVILVTTRRGTSEIPEISFSAEGGAQDFTRMLTPVNSYEYATLRNLAQQNDGLGDAFSAEALEKYRTGSDPLRYPNTNWNDILIKSYSLQQRYNLNISGAGKAMKYFVNAGYLNQGGQFNTEKNLPYDPRFFLNRYNFRSNIDLQINKSLKAFLNVAGYLEKRNSPFGISIFSDLNTGLAQYSPVMNILNYANELNATVPGPLTPDGQVMTSPTVQYPSYGQINRSGYIQQTRSNVMATYGMEQALDFITKGLSAKAVVSFDSRTISNLFAIRNHEKYVQVIDPVLNGSDGEDSVYYRLFNGDKNTPLSLSGGRFFTTLSNVQAYINYNRNFSKHNVSGLVLYQQQQNIIDAQLPYKLIGVSTRMTYNYDSRYLFEFNAGYNGSEQFAPGNRFGFFPAVSGGWVVSNEDFFDDVKVINSLKIRGSYGEVGNDRLSDIRFLYLDNIQLAGGGYSQSLGDNGTQVTTSLLGNEKIQWEVARKSNIGLEIGLLNSINIVVDVYKERRDNILRSRGTVPILNGLPLSALPPVNVGIVENKGYEIEINYQKRFNKDFSVLSKVNLNYASNRQVFADEPLLTSDYAFRYRQTGYRIGQMFGYVVDRYFTDEDDIAKSPEQNVGGHASRPGDFKYKDLNGDNLVNELDLAPIGYSSVPEYTFGAAFNVTYKDFDLSVLFQGVTNVYNYYQSKGTFAETNYVGRHLESWTAERQANGDPINYPRLTTQQSPNEIMNSFFIIDASYIRLKNLELGYRLPQKWSQKVGSKYARFYVNALNLLTWDRLPTKDIDPELIGPNNYPITRLVNMGINITF